MKYNNVISLCSGAIVFGTLLGSLILGNFGEAWSWLTIGWLVFLLWMSRRRNDQLQDIDKSLALLLLKDLYAARDSNPWTTLHQFISYREHVGAFKRIQGEAEPDE